MLIPICPLLKVQRSDNRLEIKFGKIEGRLKEETRNIPEIDK